MGKEENTGSNKMIHVILADDHRYIRTVLQNYINRSPDIQVVGEAADGFEALELLKALKPDVLILDMEMAGLSGVDVLRRLKTKHSSVHILALSAQNDSQYIHAVLDLGADEYLIKDVSLPNILDAIRQVVRGKRRAVQSFDSLPARA